MPRDAAPPTHAAFREWYEGKLASDEMCLTDEARYIGYATAFEIPLPRLHQPCKRVQDLLMLGSLPPRARELYGIPYSRSQARAFRATAAAVRSARRLTPDALARGWNTASFELVARTERLPDRARQDDAPGARRRARRDEVAAGHARGRRPAAA